MSLLAVLDDSELFLTLTQKQMLDALLGEGAVSDEAVRDWAAAVDIDALDAASYRLVPALYVRAGSNPALRPLLRRMKGIYRYYFYRNKLSHPCRTSLLGAGRGWNRFHRVQGDFNPAAILSQCFASIFRRLRYSRSSARQRARRRGTGQLRAFLSL